jgi:hypothetical protein
LAGAFFDVQGAVVGLGLGGILIGDEAPYPVTIDVIAPARALEPAIELIVELGLLLRFLRVAITECRVGGASGCDGRIETSVTLQSAE